MNFIQKIYNNKISLILSFIAFLMSFCITLYCYHKKIEYNTVNNIVYTMILSMTLFGMIQNFIDNNSSYKAYLFSGLFASLGFFLAFYIISTRLYWPSLFIIFFTTLFYIMGGIIGQLIGQLSRVYRYIVEIFIFYFTVLIKGDKMSNWIKEYGTFSGIAGAILASIVTIIIAFISPSKKEYNQGVSIDGNIVVSGDSVITGNGNINITKEVSNNSDRIVSIQKRLNNLQSQGDPVISYLIQKAKDALYSNNLDEA